jgi:hypothetical protein
MSDLDERYRAAILEKEEKEEEEYVPSIDNLQKLLELSKLSKLRTLSEEEKNRYTWLRANCSFLHRE